VDPDEIEPARSCKLVSQNVRGTTGEAFPEPAPGEHTPISTAGNLCPGGPSNVVAVLAAAIINSYVVAHPIMITVIVTIFALATMLAQELTGSPSGGWLNDLGDGLHSGGFSIAYLVQGRTGG
jgi:hypothetical protein